MNRVVTIDRFPQGTTQPLEFDNAERADIATREALDVQMFEGGDQHITGLRMNRDFEAANTPPLVVLGPYIASVLNPEIKYDATQLAAALPETPLLVLDNLSHGHSSVFSPEQKREMWRYRRFSLVGQTTLLQVVRAAYPNNPTFDTAGTSMGGAVGLEMARQAALYDMTPRYYVGRETAGMDKQIGPQLNFGYFVQETRDQKRYKENPEGQGLRESYESFVQKLVNEYGYDLDSALSFGGVYKNDGMFVLPSIAFRSPMATGIGFELLEKALHNNPDFKAYFLSAGRSKVTRWPAVQPQVEKLLEAHPDRLEWELWPEDNHGVGLAPQAPRLARFTQFALATLTNK